MRKGSMSRYEAMQAVGRIAVEAVEAENCEFTNRVQTDGDTAVEFSASVAAIDADGDCILTAYYYQDPDILNEVDDFGDLDWQIEGYEIE